MHVMTPPDLLVPLRLQRFPPHTQFPPHLLQALRLVRIDSPDQVTFVLYPRPRGPSRAGQAVLAFFRRESLQDLANFAQGRFASAEYQVAIRLHRPYRLQALPSPA